MSNLRELKAALPADFVSKFKEKADSLGMTHRQLAAICISLGYQSVTKIEERSYSLPPEPPPVSADSLEEKAAVSRVAEGDEAKRNLPFTSPAL
ncbi:hypothetical protein [Desulfosarcina ovata]|uniref:Uncharacterized protein n=1 Tax=Desulfosarcina ovata subsp. ovata TaxID=2752305 RepID=A0A5K8AD51_9BACT|nr:hypothetical protein [Desulfosarcina ovata]BBO89924.1 hypothetical protein DSCOOX_31040 [Desulfosarcina ovata subsp. ovata]